MTNGGSAMLPLPRQCWWPFVAPGENADGAGQCLRSAQRRTRGDAR